LLQKALISALCALQSGYCKLARPASLRSGDTFCFDRKLGALCRYPGGADGAALCELRDACAGAMRYAQEHNAYGDESEGQAALIIAWQCVVEVTFTRR